jgi:2-polyprenyl-6-methoxyphenol hydroxylase-like FAD-dependent oxidoreductase
MSTHDFQVAVLGSGPVGMVAALELSKRYRTALITNQLPSADEDPTVEAVPASLLALLVEYGIRPHTIGVDRLYQARLIAWENCTFAESMGPVAAHVERPALDLAILDALLRSQRVTIILREPSASLDTLAGSQSQVLRLIDATGRRSVTAGDRIHPTRPWVARTFLTSRQGCSVGGELRIAALPSGFVYRLGAAKYVILGIVGRGKMLAGDLDCLEQHLSEYGAGWIVAGLPPIAEMTPGKSSPASVQWTGGGVVRRIGDAALARDTLSSQGLACGISEALYAAAIRDDKEESLLSLRQFEQRVSHLRSLASLIARCRFRDDEAWTEYAQFIARHLVYEPPLSTVSLSAGNYSLSASP